MDDNSAYLEVFFEETDTYLASLNEGVLILEDNPEDIETMNAIFRSAHTLKGMAATMGYDKMAKLTHQMENLFEKLKSGDIPVSHDIISLIFRCLDALSEIVEDLREGGDGDLDVTHLVGDLKKAANESVVVEEDENGKVIELIPELKTLTDDVLEDSLSTDKNLYMVAIRLDEASPMKGVRAFLIINEVKNVGEIILSEPSDEVMGADDYDGIINLLVSTEKSAGDLKALISAESDVADVVVKEAEKPKKKEDAPKKQKIQKRQTINVDLNKLDQFMNLVGEIVIHRSRLEDITQAYDIPEVAEPLESIERITTELQDVVLQLRMQPFKVATQRFPRMIRDLADDLGKEFNLVIEGEDTELDRTVVSELSEPLVHLLRNAADHGVEEPEVREQQGKDRVGVITVGAYTEGNRVMVTVGDDGKGMKPEDIARSAESKGIDTSGLSDNEIIQLIFHPGFSTKKEVTGVSGRGVGMDVVREKINSLNGTIEIESTPGKGSTFRINLPLTLSIIQSLLVKAGGRTFAVPQSTIEKIEEFEEDLLETVHEAQVYNYKGKLLPVVYLNDLLGYEKNMSVDPHVIFVKIRGTQYAVIVESIMDQKEIVIKDLGEELKGMNEYLGATVLGNGEIILIVDLSIIEKMGRDNYYEAG